MSESLFYFRYSASSADGLFHVFKRFGDEEEEIGVEVSEVHAQALVRELRLEELERRRDEGLTP